MSKKIYREFNEIIDNLRPSTLLKWIANRDNGIEQEYIDGEITEMHQTLTALVRDVVSETDSDGLKAVINELKLIDSNNPRY